jgi:hypothetical protein
VDKQKQHVEVVKTPALFRGGIAKPSIWYRNVELIPDAETNPEMKKTYHIDFREVRTPVLVRDGTNACAQILALNFNHISDSHFLMPRFFIMGTIKGLRRLKTFSV